MSNKKLMNELKETVKFLRKKYKPAPQVGIVLGSGLGNFVDEISIEEEVAYGDIRAGCCLEN
jgi:purine-nucleoside phosphorylase